MRESLRSVCPKCIEEVDAVLFDEDGKIFLEKDCPDHGRSKVLVSNDAVYYNKIRRAYLSSNAKGKRNYYNIYTTMDCNLNCPICLTRAHRKYDEPSISQIKEWVKDLKNTKIGIWGGEPTVRKDLFEIIRTIKKSGNSPSLYTNGIMLTKKYINGLKKAGVEVVHLQFDGFDEKAYEVLRGAPLLETKNKVIARLNSAGIPVVLETTFARGLNEHEIGNTISLAAKTNNITAVLVRSYSHLGAAGLSKKSELLREELISLAEEQTNGLVSKEYLINFQKLMFAFYDFMDTKRCFYNHYILFERTRNGRYKPIISANELRSIAARIDEYHKHGSKAKLSLNLLKHFITPSKLKYILLALSMLAERRLLKGSFTSSGLSKKVFIVGFGCICNADTFDNVSAEYCIGGEISTDYGVVDSLVGSNLKREKDNL
ncbi:radical SAM protein [Candidatus Woesearchaeota archaeon]|nr:radical SAM protein [Candidatus Woesearchaeota archaeon]